jgi:hypothetical protein
MQVIVSKSELATAAVIKVIGTFEDSVEVPDEMKRSGFAVLSLPPKAVQNGQFGSVLAPDWREGNKRQVIMAEAARRSLEAFPQHEQLNAVLDLLMAQQGAAEPKDAQRRRDEMTRVWTYLNAVRAKARGMLAGPLPPDPTADGHWPARISAYQSA